MSTPASQGRNCPEVMTLRRFLTEELADAAATAVQEHVEDCPACQQELRRLVGGVPGPLDALAGTRACRNGRVFSTKPKQWPSCNTRTSSLSMRPASTGTCPTSRSSLSPGA